MDILTALGAAVRRWYVSVPILLVAVALAVVTYASAQATWSTNRLFVTTPPNQVVVDGRPQSAPANSIAVAGGTRLLATLLSQNLNSPSVSAGIVAAGGTGYASSVPDNNFPLISVQAQGSDAESASRTLDLVAQRMNLVFDDVQTRVAVPADAKYRVSPVTVASPPVASVPNRTRALVATLVAGVVLAVLAAALVDALVRRRRPSSHREGRTQPGALPVTSDGVTRNATPARVSNAAGNSGGSTEDETTDVTGRAYVTESQPPAVRRRVNVTSGRSWAQGSDTGSSAATRAERE